MKRIILIFFAAIGAGVVLLFVAALALSWIFLSSDSLPERIVLEVDLTEGIVETFPDDPLLLALGDGGVRSRDVVLALERGKDDPRVRALFMRGDGGLAGWASAEEIREAVSGFRESGKPTYFFTESFGELSPGQLSYYLATAFDEIHLQPSGDLGLAPLLMESLFFRGLLDRWEIVPRFDRRAEYKDASEIFTETEFTPAAREARRVLLESLEGSLIDGIGAGRGVPRDRAVELLYGGPYLAREALEGGLVDELGYLDQVYARIEEGIEGAPVYLSPRGYLEGIDSPGGGAPRVALIYGIGAIYRGAGGYDFLSGANSLGSATVAAAIREASDDPRVDAILFRVDSPGGSWPASDQIRRELRRAQEQGIPVVVSMGNLAASGGYVISMDADLIVAHPSTITGSIGVVGGKLVMDEFLASLGIDSDQIMVDEGGDSFYASMGDFSPRDWERFQLFLDRVYEDFVQGVADGREMTFDEVDAIARGRIWSGKDALEVGLVDRLGGFPTALDGVRELLGEAADSDLELVVYPAERTLFQLLMEEAENTGGAGVLGGGPVGAAAALLADGMRGAARSGLLPAQGIVRSPEWEVPGR